MQRCFRKIRNRFCLSANILNLLSIVLLKNGWNILYEIIFYKYNFLHAGYFFMLLLSFADFFINIFFSKNSFKNNIRVSNCLDPDQDGHSFSPNLGPNCLYRLSAEDKSCCLQ